MSDLTDIERIEVLQGPQGTLYGKNTNAGAISVITKRTNFEEFEGYVEASAGDYSMYRLTASASGPISDTMAFRLSGNVHQRDGYYDNSAGDDLNDADDWNIQGKLLWEPTDSLSILFSGSHIDRDTTCCAADAVQSESVNNELANQGFRPDKNDPYDYDVQPGVDNSFDMESDLLSMTINYDIAWGEITSITAWNDYDYDYSVDQDPDRSQLDVLAVRNDDFSGDSFSQELRFTSQAGDNIDYMLGVFYYKQDTDTIAVFSQATWHIGDIWHLTGGLRWSDEEKESDLFSQTNSTAPSAGLLGRYFLDSVSTPIDAKLDRSSDNVDWMVRAAMDIGDVSMIYASAATGTKSGGFQSVNGAPDEREFDDEDTTTYELGVKSTLLDARLRINAAAFYSEIDDSQSQRQLETGLGTFVSNEAEVEVSGLDFQVEALPLPNLTLSAGLEYLLHRSLVSRGKARIYCLYTRQQVKAVRLKQSPRRKLKLKSDRSALLSSPGPFGVGPGGMTYSRFEEPGKGCTILEVKALGHRGDG